VCLLGDAAHPTLPFLAQGANMAIEDAAVMARCLDDGLRRAGDLTAALRRFETLRWQRTADIVNRSADNATRFHNPRLADPAYAEAYIDSEWDSEKVRHRYDWLFAYDALSG
jgi:salicylate hydroxylase